MIRVARVPARAPLQLVDAADVDWIYPQGPCTNWTGTAGLMWSSAVGRAFCGAAPPASRALASLASLRDRLRRPLTPEPLRPLRPGRAGRDKPCPLDARPTTLSARRAREGGPSIGVIAPGRWCGRRFCPSALARMHGAADALLRLLLKRSVLVEVEPLVDELSL